MNHSCFRIRNSKLGTRESHFQSNQIWGTTKQLVNLMDAVIYCNVSVQRLPKFLKPSHFLFK